MQLPGDRKYVVSHEWAKDEDGVVLVGITDFAQDQLGDLVFVGDFTPGTRLAAGATAGVVESVKAASDIYAPVAGELVEFNQALSDAPHLINEAPFDTWIFKLKADNPADLQGLLDGPAYAARLFNLAVNVGYSRFEHAQGRGPWRWSHLLWPILKRLVADKLTRRLGGRIRLAVSGGAALPPDTARIFIGLGVTGAGCALDAVARGLTVLAVALACGSDPVAPVEASANSNWTSRARTSRPLMR